MEENMLVFVTGGVRSGKSSWAEQYVRKASRNEKNIHYVATAVQTDDEMKKRILDHQKRRETSKAKWVNWEKPRDIKSLASHFSGSEIVLLDCLTNLVNNELFFGVENGDERWKDANHHQYVFQSIQQGIEKLYERTSLFVIVSNEVVYDSFNNEVLFAYMKLLGKCHQWIIQKADIAVKMEFGVPVFMKGK